MIAGVIGDAAVARCYTRVQAAGCSCLRTGDKTNFWPADAATDGASDGASDVPRCIGPLYRPLYGPLYRTTKHQTPNTKPPYHHQTPNHTV